jgi:hypothetical protein
MNDEQQGPGPGGQPGQEQISQEELRQRLEEQLRKLRVQDLMVESAVSVLNLTARRISKEDERDLEQARVGIEAVRAWLELLPADAARQIRNALSDLQVLYANAAQGEGGAQPEEAPVEGAEPGKERPGGEADAPQEPSQRREGPSRLWTPPGSS